MGSLGVLDQSGSNTKFKLMMSPEKDKLEGREGEKKMMSKTMVVAQTISDHKMQEKTYSSAVKNPKNTLTRNTTEKIIDSVRDRQYNSIYNHLKRQQGIVPSQIMPSKQPQPTKPSLLRDT